MITYSRDFTFGGMLFNFVYQDDDTLDVPELSIEGQNKQARTALECDNFNKAISEFVMNKMVNKKISQ